MTTATRKADCWVKGTVLLNGGDGPGAEHQGTVRGNLGLYHDRDTTKATWTYPWWVAHQPSGLVFFRSRTRKLAMDTIDRIERVHGLDWIDRLIDGTDNFIDREIRRTVRGILHATDGIR